MINSVIVTNHLGESLEMVLANPYETGFAITSIKGLGPTKANINITEMATSDGGLFNSARQNARNIVFNISFLSLDGDIESVRQKTYKFFPVKKRVTLEIITDNRDAEITGYVESNEPNIFSQEEACQISIICPNPYFYSGGKDGEQTINFNSFSSMFEFPWAELYNMNRLPHGFENYSYYEPQTGRTLYTLEFGSIANYGAHSIYYEGDVDTGIRISMHAIDTVVNPTIYSTSSQESITINTQMLEQLTGHGFIARDTIEISTVKGEKYVHLIREGRVYNIINCVGKNVGWFQLMKGDNVFTYSALSGVENLQLSVSNKILYEGI